jgi:F0F1-type ATP synthase delta subunit
MKPEAYAQALMRLVNEGSKPAEAVKKMHAMLEAQGRASLMSAIGRAFEKLAATDAARNRSVLVIAKAKDEHAARKQSGAKEAKIVIDESLIGGWRLEEGESLQDASWKNHLVTIYNRATS